MRMHDVTDVAWSTIARTLSTGARIAEDVAFTDAPIGLHHDLPYKVRARDHPGFDTNVISHLVKYPHTIHP